MIIGGDRVTTKNGVCRNHILGRGGLPEVVAVVKHSTPSEMNVDVVGVLSDDGEVRYFTRDTLTAVTSIS